MGASNSIDTAEFCAKYGTHYAQGKPGIPEGIPKVTDITHNSITLVWLSPLNCGRILAYQIECCNLKDKKWRIVTSTCQGTNYRVRNLAPESCYLFRVRSENMIGQSKPSYTSEEVRTRPIPTNYLLEKPVSKLVRRHSHYLKLDNSLANLLSKTEEDQVDSGSNIGSIPFRRNSTRGSLPTGFRTKRNSVTSLLPGGQRESMCSLKESKKSFEESSMPEEEGLNLKRISTSSTEGSSLFSSNSMTSIAEDEELRILYGQQDCQMCSDNDDTCSSTNSHMTMSSGCSSHSSHCHQSTHNALVHSCPPINENSNILTASITDDNKMDYITNPEKMFNKSPITNVGRMVNANASDGRTVNANASVGRTVNPNASDGRTVNASAGKTIFEICDNENEIWKGRIENQCAEITPNNNQSNVNVSRNNTLDLRSIRNMLNSQDIMVKTLDTRSLEYMRRTHCAIKELDEDVTVDIVSTI